MLLPILKSIRTLLSYVIAASFVFSPLIPHGQYIGYAVSAFLLLQLPFIRKCDYCFSTWYVIDVLVCHLIHNTGTKRTISGWTGQHMNSKKRYCYQAKVIDLIFGKDHCWNEYLREKAQGHA